MFKSKSLAESDPLLPNNEPSPEVHLYGTSPAKDSYEIRYPEQQEYGQNDEDNDKGHYEPRLPASSPRASTETNETTRASAWGTLISFISFVVLFALVFVSLRPNTGDSSPQPPSAVPVPIPGRPPQSGLTLDDRVTQILTDTPLLDGHNDLAILVRAFYKNDIQSAGFRDKFENGGLYGHVDLPRLKKGMVGGAFWSAYVSCSNNASEDFSDAEYGHRVAETLQQIDLVKRLQRQYSDWFSPAGTSLADMRRQFHDKRLMFGPASIEGLHQVPQSAAMATLRLYYELGVRAATLTWNCHNRFADAALTYLNGKTIVTGYHRGGVTADGRKVITEMNRLGMIVDLSHTSYWTQKSVLSAGTSKAPVVFTHSSAWSLCPHPRNVKDDILDLVKETNSVVQVNFSPDFISCVDAGGDMPEYYPKNATLDQVVRHIMYIGEKIGYDHVGLGSDFDGIETTPEGLDGVDKYPSLIKELLKKGVSDVDAAKIAGENVLRVWHAVEEVSQEMQRDGYKQGEDEIDDMYMQAF